MSRKHYVAIAEAIREARYLSDSATATEGETVAVRKAMDTVASEIADVLARDNSRFDRSRFLTACQERA